MYVCAQFHVCVLATAPRAQYESMYHRTTGPSVCRTRLAMQPPSILPINVDGDVNGDVAAEASRGRENEGQEGKRSHDPACQL